MDKIIAQKTPTADLTGEDREGWGRAARSATITATAQLGHIEGNTSPHFSVTADIHINGVMKGGGCQHDLVLRYFPELAPVAALHLSDDKGEPMHSVENALYHAGAFAGSSWAKDDYGPKPDVLAEHLRISREAAEILISEIAGGVSMPHKRKAMSAFVDAQRDRWRREADEALAILHS